MVSNILQGTFKNSIFAVLLDLTQKVVNQKLSYISKKVFFYKNKTASEC